MDKIISPKLAYAIIIVIGAIICCFLLLQDNTVSTPNIINYQPRINQRNTPDIGLANPASVYCEQNGGKLEIVTAADGSQSGNCILPDGTKCEEWAYYRGDCKKSTDTISNDSGMNKSLCEKEGGTWGRMEFYSIDGPPGSANVCNCPKSKSGTVKIIFESEEKKCN